VLTIHQDEIEREQNRYLFRTKTDNKSIAMEHQKSDDDETENSKHGTEHDNATPREKKELSLSLSLSSLSRALFSPKDLLFLCGRNNAEHDNAEHIESTTISREGDV
jgi:hypothetical protein